MAILIDNPTEALIEHPEDLRTETPDANEMLCRDFFDDVWARGNDDRVSDYLDDHFVWKARVGYAPDRAGYAQSVRDLHRGFPDLYGDVSEVFAGRDCVAVHWMFEGHQENDWNSIRATGKKARMEGLTIAEVHNGRITREFTVSNDLEALAQLDVEDLRPFAPPKELPESGPSMWQRLRKTFQ